MPQSDRLTHAFETGQLVPPAGPTLVLRARPSPGLRALNDPVAEQSMRPVHDALAASGYPVQPRQQGTFPSALVNLTRSRDESLGLIARAWNMVELGGTILVNGAKTDGVDAILKTLRKHADISTVIPKAHGKFFEVRRSTSALPDWHLVLEFSTNNDGFQTAAGMFSAERVDDGSRLLASHFSKRLKGRIGDLGAGWGWLSHAACAASDAFDEIHLIEAEKVALDAARLNVGDSRARFHWADATTHQDRFDTIISNPPFHADRKPDPSLGIAFIHAAARMLTPGGRLLLVANRMLPYEETLSTVFRRVERREQTNRFKVFEAAKPK